MFENTEENFISETVAFIEQNERWLESTIGSLGWSTKDLAAFVEVSEPEHVCCPVNREHRMPASSLESHLVKCEKNNASYPDVSNLELSATLQHTDTVLKLESDHDTVRECEMVGATAAKTSSSQTLAELLKAERDAKRRRAAHRGKRVHSNKKSYNEVMREVIANQMLTIGDTVVNDEGCSTDSRANNQEPVATNFSYLGVGSRYYRGNPHKRWLTIEREEEETMAEIQKQSTRRREDRYERYSRHNDDRCGSRRDGRDESDRSRTSSKRDHDYRRDELRYGENRRENRVRIVDDRHSRHDEARRNREEYRASNTRDLKRNESRNFADRGSKEHRDRRPSGYQGDLDSIINDEIVSSNRHKVNRSRRDRETPDTKNSERDEHHSSKRRETHRAHCPEGSDSEEYVSKREHSFQQSEESSEGEKKRKTKKKKKKKKKHKHKKKHKRDSKSD